MPGDITRLDDHRRPPVADLAASLTRLTLTLMFLPVAAVVSPFVRPDDSERSGAVEGYGVVSLHEAREHSRRRARQ